MGLFKGNDREWRDKYFETAINTSKWQLMLSKGSKCYQMAMDRVKTAINAVTIHRMRLFTF